MYHLVFLSYLKDKLNEMSGNELHHEKLRKSVPVNVGPGGTLYMYNKHHTIRALYESSHPDSRKWYIMDYIDFFFL